MEDFTMVLKKSSNAIPRDNLDMIVSITCIILLVIKVRIINLIHLGVKLSGFGTVISVFIEQKYSGMVVTFYYRFMNRNQFYKILSKNSWLQPKFYPHIDLPATSQKTTLDLYHYVKDCDSIAKHAFLPLIRRNIVSYPFKKRKSEWKKKDDRKKVRMITYASHKDAAIYGYYAQLLQVEYEKFISQANLSNNIVAYRKIPKENGRGNKCNIEIANDAFSEIKARLNNKEEVAAITFDIKGFFDNLDHQIIKNTWMRVMNWDRMPDDVFNVYKSIVRYSYIYETELFELFQNDLVTYNKKDNKLTNKRVKRKQYFRDKNVIAYCKKDKINFIRGKHLIRTRSAKEVKGIPQGLPISATIANVYMMDIDVAVVDFLKQYGGVYKRYSDDIIIICPKEYGKDCKDYMMSQINNVKLEIESSKTNLFNFVYNGENIQCLHETEGRNKKLEYLGFSFDGNRTLIKEAGIGKFYNKMSRAVKRASYHAFHIHNNTRGIIFERKLITRFTNAGSKTGIIQMNSDKQKRKPQDAKEPKGLKTKYGNFFSYVNKSAKEMQAPAIKRQLRRSIAKLKRLIIYSKQSVRIKLIKRMWHQINFYGRTFK